MSPDEILDGLEDGRLDVTKALELFKRGGAPDDGRVRLRPLGVPSPRRASGPAAKVRLRPLSRGAAEPEVVKVSRPEPGIVVVALEDEAGKNMFGPRLRDALERAFADVRADREARVVVVHGFGTWFASGGTPEMLEDIRMGRARFTDYPGFRALLDLEVPAVAAMQGHALGGGLTFGLYADLIVLAEESYYAGNFMEHGFTPGVGATHLFPLKLGEVLGTEMLYTARRYTGRELKDRGAPLIVEKRERVIERALELARDLARKPRLQLELLKRRLTEKTRRALPEVIAAEDAMHQEVFGR